MQTFIILDIIMNRTKYVETSTTFFMIVQVLLSSYMQVMFFYKQIKSRDFMQKIFACFLPAWLIAGWCAIIPFTFGSFVNGGVRGILADKIIAIAQTSAFIGELVAVSVVFVAMMALYLWVARPKWIQLLLNFGAETAMLVFSLCLFIPLQMGLLLFNDIGLSYFNIAIYCYFMVIYKTIFTMVALLVAAIFREKKRTTDQQQTEFLTDADFERYARKFLNQHQKQIALTFAVVIIVMDSFLTIVLLWDSGLSFSLKNVVTAFHVVPGLLLFLIGMLAWMIYLLIFAFFPQLSDGYRTLKQDGKMFEQFFYEVVQSHSSLATGKEIATKHFIVNKRMFFIDVIIKRGVDS